MTAESLKAFITLPTAAVYGKDHSSSSSHNHQKVKLFCFSVFLAAFCVTVSCYQVWDLLRTNELRKEVVSLRQQMDSMRKRMGLEDFGDLEDFGNVYDPHTGLPEHVLEEDPENAIFSNDLNDFDEDLEDMDYNEMYDLDDVDPYLPHDDDLAGSGDTLHHNNDDEDIEDKQDDKQESVKRNRKPRALRVHPENVKTDPETDDRPSDVLINRRSPPKLYYDWSKKETEAPNSRYENMGPKLLRRSQSMPSLHEPSSQESHRIASPIDSNVIEGNHENPSSRIRHRNHHHHQNGHPESLQRLQESHRNDLPVISHSYHDTTTASPLHVRGSRVMDTNDQKSRAFRQIITKREYAQMKLLQKLKSGPKPREFVEAKAHPEMRVYPASSPVRRQNRRLIRKSAGSGSARVARQGASLIAVQLNGDASRYNTGSHDHYLGNGLLRHSGGAYHDWTTAHWVNHLNLDRYFGINSGVVTVREAGLYYVYAQMYYKDEHDNNGYTIEHNSSPLFQCTAMAHSRDRMQKSNSCYTGGMVFLRPDDTVKVVDLFHDRKVILDGAKSYFGLVRLGGMQQQPQQSDRMQRMQQMPQPNELTDSPTMNPNPF